MLSRVTIKKFTFVEIVIACAIFLLLMTVVYNLFISSSRRAHHGTAVLTSIGQVRNTISHLFNEIQESSEIIVPSDGAEGNWCVFKNHKDDYFCIYRDSSYRLIRNDIRFNEHNDRFDISSDLVNFVFEHLELETSVFLKKIIDEKNGSIQKKDLEKFMYVLKNNGNWLTGKGLIKTVDRKKVILEKTSDIRFFNTGNNRLMTAVTVFSELKNNEPIGSFTLIDEVFLMNSLYND